MKISSRLKTIMNDLDTADTLIVNSYYKLKQEGKEKAATMLLFDASVKVQDAIDLIENEKEG